MVLKDYIPAQIKDTARNVVLPEAAALYRLMPPLPDTSCLTVICRRADYSASAIARAVEDCDAHIVNLNVTADTTPDGDIVTELRVTHRNPQAVARSLERYGYTVAISGTDTQSPDMERMRERANELIHYLEL